MSDLENWSEEKRSAYLYRAVADREAGTTRRGLFIELADEAEKQAAMWAARAEKAGFALPQFRPDARARVVAVLVGKLGPRRLRTVLAAMKVRGMSLYENERRGHAKPNKVEDVGQGHQVEGGGNLRAAVFGVNDGLISNASLIMGIAGATSDTRLILLSGAAGLIAGAFSMAAGEYVSVKSQRELYEYQIGLEREELDHYPEAEAEELALIYEARGLSREQAIDVARTLIADPEHALDTLAREELGLNPADLGSPIGAAGFSFVSFAAGAALPLAPFFFAAGSSALGIAVVLTGTALFGIGATLSLFTGRNAWYGGGRMLAIGAAAGAVTWGIGRMLGVAL